MLNLENLEAFFSLGKYNLLAVLTIYTYFFPKCRIPFCFFCILAIAKGLPKGIITKPCQNENQSNLCTVQLKLHHYT